MKRIGNLFATVAMPDNLLAAFYLAGKGKWAKGEVIRYGQALEVNLASLHARLLSGNFLVGSYRQFRVYDPKERMITVAPFEQGILHHAIMRVCETYFDRRQIHHSYACRKGKGRVAALDAAERFGRRQPFYLKMDIRKYFDSVDHVILKAQLRQIFKDAALLQLLDAIIDSFEVSEGKGLPIGNLTSQHFANLYLSCFDHWVTSNAKKAGLHYIRYMDDMVLWGRYRTQLCGLREEAQCFFNDELHLKLKQARIGVVAHGVPFLGCKVFAGYRTLDARSRRRFCKKIHLLDRLLADGRIDENEAQQRGEALCAFARTACSYAYRHHVLTPHFRVPAMGETATAPTAASAAAAGTTARAIAPSRTGTTTTRPTGTTTMASAWPAAQERRCWSPSIPEPAVIQPPPS